MDIYIKSKPISIYRGDLFQRVETKVVYMLSECAHFDTPFLLVSMEGYGIYDTYSSEEEAARCLKGLIEDGFFVQYSQKEYRLQLVPMEQ